MPTMTDEQMIEYLNEWAMMVHGVTPSRKHRLEIAARLRELARFESEWKFVPDDKGGHMFNKANGSKWYPEPTDARTALGEKA